MVAGTVCFNKSIKVDGKHDTRVAFKKETRRLHIRKFSVIQSQT